MKKFIVTILALFMVNMAVYAGQAIDKTTDGTKLKCTGTKKGGTIKQYDGKQVVDYYEFKDGKLYSANMFVQFAKESKKDHKPQKVKKLKISDSEITFKDTYYSQAWADYKWATINRANGDYYFKAKRDNLYGGFNQKAEVSGRCSIIK